MIGADLEELLRNSDIKRMPLRDGDVLAVYVPRDITDAEACHISQKLRDATGLDVKAFVLPPGFDVKVMSREEAGDDDHGDSGPDSTA